jgi:RNA polymerase sigma-70 factor (ECF subfamily)
MATHAEWREWLNDHTPKFLLYARQKARLEADAQDLVQEAVVEAMSRNEASLPPMAVVFSTIHRRAIDQARSEDRRAAREFKIVESGPQVWFDNDVETREQSQLIQSAMKQLPDIYREVVTLKVWGELTFAEIAGMLAIPQNTAASRYRYGLEQLRKLTKEVLA